MRPSAIRFVVAGKILFLETFNFHVLSFLAAIPLMESDTPVFLIR